MDHGRNVGDRSGGGVCDRPPLIERCPWGEARPGLVGTFGDDELELEREVADGLAHCWRLEDGSAYLLTRLEIAPQGDELVIICAKGRGVADAMPAIQQRARELGIGSIRFHTPTPALGRLAGRYGFAEVERVYRVKL